MTERSIRDILVNDGRPNGIVRDMPREQYHGLSRINATSLKAGMIGSRDIDPVLIRDTFEQTRPEPSAELQASYDRGSLCHAVLFEPEKLVDTVAVWRGDRRTGAEWKEFNEQNAGKLIMRAADVREVQQACRAVRSVPQVNDLLRRKHETELTVFGKISRSFAIGRPDCVTTDSGPCTLIDLKTTKHGLDESSTLRTIRTLNYREQLAMYANLYAAAAGRDVEAAYLLFISLEPVGVRLVRLTSGALQFGWSRITQAVESVERCIDAQNWPIFFGESLCDVSDWEIDDVDLEGLQS